MPTRAAARRARSPSPAPAPTERKRVMWWTLSVPAGPASSRYLHRYRWGFLWQYVRKDDRGSAAAAKLAEAAAARATINIDAVERQRRSIMSGTAALCALVTAALLLLSEAEPSAGQRAQRLLLALPLAVAFAYGGSAGCGL